MEQTAEEFFHDFRQDLLADSESSSSYQLEAFMRTVSDELVDTGFIDGFEYCHYRAPRGMRVDGYWFDDEGNLDLFIADFECRRTLETLTRTEADAALKRVANFFESCAERNLRPDVTTPEYGLANQIADRAASLLKIRFYLLSERALSDRAQGFTDNIISGVAASYHIWDITRIQRQRTSRGQKEPLDINFPELFGKGISCLPAHLDAASYPSYLIVMPAEVVAALYEKYSARLLEQNVRTFLQARGQVNKGIRDTIINEPQKFFAYNNGISATAASVDTRETAAGLQITRLTDLQIVNGGQTTASLYHTQKKDKANLSKIFVQMKLTVISGSDSETVVPKISEYANTQNRVNAADLFSNSGFHVRMESFSRRLWAPAQAGTQRETKWFYERARGQYADAQSKLTAGEQKRFKVEFPKAQMFTKTDLAKFENVFDEHPRWVNMGSQKNFVRYANRIQKEWEKLPDDFNEGYFRRAVARGILFRTTEALVSKQSWYNGGYRANITAYTLSMLGEIVKQEGLQLDYPGIWSRQKIDPTLNIALETISAEIYRQLISPPPGISNISEWAKKESCWDDRLLVDAERIAGLLSPDFRGRLVSKEEGRIQKRSDRDTQRIDNGIEAQKHVLSIPGEAWRSLQAQMTLRGLLSPRESGIMSVAAAIPARLPSETQSRFLVMLLERARREGLLVQRDG
jgi:AIPR protein